MNMCRSPCSTTWSPSSTDLKSASPIKQAADAFTQSGESLSSATLTHIIQMISSVHADYTGQVHKDETDLAHHVKAGRYSNGKFQPTPLRHDWGIPDTCSRRKPVNDMCHNQVQPTKAAAICTLTCRIDGLQFWYIQCRL